MLQPDPGCLLHRQAGAWIQELAEEPTIGTDIDVFPVPQIERDGVAPLIVNGEFVTALTSEPGVAELVSYLLDPDSGVVWAQEGGFVSPHPEFDPADYADEFDRRRAELIAAADAVRFDGSDTMPSAVGTGSFWSGVTEFVASRDLDQAVLLIDSGFATEDPTTDSSS